MRIKTLILANRYYYLSKLASHPIMDLYGGLTVDQVISPLYFKELSEVDSEEDYCYLTPQQISLKNKIRQVALLLDPKINFDTIERQSRKNLNDKFNEIKDTIDLIKSEEEDYLEHRIMMEERKPYISYISLMLHDIIHQFIRPGSVEDFEKVPEGKEKELGAYTPQQLLEEDLAAGASGTDKMKAIHGYYRLVNENLSTLNLKLNENYLSDDVRGFISCLKFKLDQMSSSFSDPNLMNLYLKLNKELNRRLTRWYLEEVYSEKSSNETSKDNTWMGLSIKEEILEIALGVRDSFFSEIEKKHYLSDDLGKGLDIDYVEKPTFPQRTEQAYKEDVARKIGRFLRAVNNIIKQA